MSEKLGFDLVQSRLLLNGNFQAKSLLVNITDIDATFVGEENRVPIPVGEDADVSFFLALVGQKRFDDEGTKFAHSFSNLF